MFYDPDPTLLADLQQYYPSYMLARDYLALYVKYVIPSLMTLSFITTAGNTFYFRVRRAMTR